jgi:hypothetical protein
LLKKQNETNLSEYFAFTSSIIKTNYYFFKTNTSYKVFYDLI